MHRMPSFGFFLLLLLLLLLIGPLWVPQAESLPSVPYSQFVRDVDQGAVQEVKIAGQQVTILYRDGTRARTGVPSDSAYLASFLQERGVAVEVVPPRTRPWYASLLGGLFPVLLIVGLLWLFMRPSQGAGGRMMQFSRSKARLYKEEQGRVTLDDVAGLQEVKEDLAEVIDFLKAPEKYRELGARIPKGVLLSGPPGTGKTVLARAVAGEAGVAFFSVSGSEFVEMFAGVGAGRVRDLFEKARAGVPCIVFIDEIDAVARHRGLSVGSANEEREQTLNQLLVEMDGFGPTEGIIVIAATNRSDVLDPAILRPGRFDRVITLDLPDVKGREAILQVHVRGKPLATEVDLGRVARQTPGFSGADLANLVNEAALLAARRQKEHVGMEEFTHSLERIVTGGPERRRLISAPQRERVAIHEAGHAVVSRHLPHADPVYKISIVARGRAGGYTMYLPDEERVLHTPSQIMDRITTLLGGRAAEEICLGEISTGAMDDLERATSLARRMVTELGMDEALGPLKVDTGDESPVSLVAGLPGSRSSSDQLVKAVDDAVRRLVLESHRRAVELIQRHRNALERIARALLERETLEGDDFEQLMTTA